VAQGRIKPGANKGGAACSIVASRDLDLGQASLDQNSTHLSRTNSPGFAAAEGASAEPSSELRWLRARPASSIPRKSITHSSSRGPHPHQKLTVEDPEIHGVFSSLEGKSPRRFAPPLKFLFVPRRLLDGRGGHLRLSSELRRGGTGKGVARRDKDGGHRPDDEGSGR
jgi:hypothetical protein